jgi:hypothetical protein
LEQARLDFVLKNKVMTESSSILADSVQQRRRLLLHLKCLVWCLHQMQVRYDLNLVLYSLEHRSIHSEIANSNLGDNLTYLLEHLESGDCERLSHALGNITETVGSLDVGDKHFEMGHYLQALNDFGPVPAGAYGIISNITPQLRGLFFVDRTGQLIERTFSPADIRTIFGTYIV